MKATKQIAELIEAPRIGDVDEVNQIDLKSIELTGLKLEKLGLEAGKYNHIEFSDSLLEKLVGNNLQTFSSLAVRCVFDSCQFTGLGLPQCNFKDVIFKNCRLNLANFRSSKFGRCIFIDCDLTETDFAMSTLNNAVFDNCQLDQTEFSNCTCETTEFKNCSLGQINGLAGLKNATISQLNLIELAPILANNLGLKIAE